MNFASLSAFQLKFLAVLGIFFGVFFGWMAIHQNYFLPIHSEEWDHLLLAKQLPERIPIGVNWEIGFQILIKFLHEFSGLSYELIALILPIFVMLLASLGTFVLVRFLSKKILPALFSALLVLSLKSSITLLGLWFFVPMALGIALLPSMIYFLIKAFNSLKHALVFLLLFVQATIFHPAYTIILIPSMIVYSMLNPQVFFKNQAKIAVALILMVFLLPFFAFQLGFVSGEIDLSFDGIKTLSQGLMNRLSWEKIFEFEAKFSFLEFLGIIPFILAVIGLSSIIVLKILSMLKPSHSLVEEFFKNRHLFFLPAMALTLLALYAQFHLTGRVLFAPYERQFMAASFILLMLAGIALYYLVELMKKIFLNLGIFSAKFFRLAFLGMLSVFFISLLTISNFEFAGEFYQNASASDLSAVEWIESFNAEKNYVIAEC